MEVLENPAGIKPNYMKMAYDCLQLDCTTWYTEEAEKAFARYLEENSKKNASLDDLNHWKQLVKI